MTHLSWFSIFRLGLVQTALGAVVVLTTSTLNRVMVVELALPAMLPGALVALHYAVQLTRPRWGHGSDAGGRRTPWILGGMAALAAGGFAAAAATVGMATNVAAATALAAAAFLLIGAGVGAAGTSLLALMAVAVAPRRKAAAATLVWLMMIAGFAVTATAAGALLEPYSPQRLLEVVGGVCAVALAVAALAVRGVEGEGRPPRAAAEQVSFLRVVREVWAEPKARRFTVFVFVSMLAYSAQDLILEPFAGHVFGMTPGESTALAGQQHAGVFCGMLLVGVAASGLRLGSLHFWVGSGCLGSAGALALIVLAGAAGPGAPIGAAVFALGFFNGAFAVAAIGAMMSLAAEGAPGREGVRVGLWGAAQAVAFGLGGFLGAAAADLMRAWLSDPAAAYGVVFAAEAGLFLVSAALALRVAVAAPAPLAAEGAGR